MGCKVRNKRGRDMVGPLLSRSRYEILPTTKIESAVLNSVPLPTDVTITVTASPSKGLDATLDLTERLIGHGYRVVPHLAARMIANRSELESVASRLLAFGVADVFCPAGDADPPAGEYLGSVALLEDLTAMGSPFAQVGVTGYPESHPAIADDITVQSMWDKRRHATYIVSNLCFDARTLEIWVKRMRRRGIDLPLYIGMPGPVERAKLLAMSTKIGVGQSVRFLKSHAWSFARIAAPGGYNPERFVASIAGLARDPGANVVGVHLFTFNQVAATAAWRRQLMTEKAPA
jgi:methylenetetrahydrofolate reductase (NADPH)